MRGDLRLDRAQLQIEQLVLDSLLFQPLCDDPLVDRIQLAEKLVKAVCKLSDLVMAGYLDLFIGFPAADQLDLLHHAVDIFQQGVGDNPGKNDAQDAQNRADDADRIVHRVI